MGRTTAAVVLLASIPALGGCGSDGGGTGPQPPLPRPDVDFVRFDDTFFDQIPLRDSVWAVAGEDRRIEMRMPSAVPGEDGEKFLEFRIREESLLRTPDGTPFEPGDSVLITVEVDPEGRFLFDFGPDGLEFSTDEPAELRIRYVLADRDLNGDGVIDERDEELEDDLAIWKRERPEEGWIELSSFEVAVDELEADVESFTGFALAN